MPQNDSKSSSGQEQQQTAQMAPHPYPSQFEDDSINLYEMWIILWKRKWVVFTVTIVIALGSVVYAMQQQNIYKAEALLLPPETKDILSINLPRMQSREGRIVEQLTKEITSNDVFSKFKQNLKIRTLYKKFIHENGLMEILAPERTTDTKVEDVYKNFSELFKIEDVDGLTYLTIELYDAEIAAQWVNDLIEFIDKETIVMLVEDLRNLIANQIRDIEYTIESKRKMVKQRREDQIRDIERTIESKRKISELRRQDRIQRYSEAAKTAHTLGISSGITETKLTETTSSSGVTPLLSRDKLLNPTPPSAQMNVDIATATTPLFLLGYEALNAELNNLKTRKDEDPFIFGLRDLQERIYSLKSITSDDSFIPGLRDLQEQLVLLHSIKFDEEKMHAVHVDQAAYPAKNAIKPNRRYIVSISTIVGLFLGILLVFFIEFVVSQRKKHLE